MKGNKKSEGKQCDKVKGSDKARSMQRKKCDCHGESDVDSVGLTVHHALSACEIQRYQ